MGLPNSWVDMHSEDLAFQILTSWSSEPLARMCDVLGWKVTTQGVRLCPGRTFRQFPVLQQMILTVWSPCVDASISPSGLKAAAMVDRGGGFSLQYKPDMVFSISPSTQRGSALRFVRVEEGQKKPARVRKTPWLWRGERSPRPPAPSYSPVPVPTRRRLPVRQDGEQGLAPRPALPLQARRAHVLVDVHVARALLPVELVPLPRLPQARQTSLARHDRHGAYLVSKHAKAKASPSLSLSARARAKPHRRRKRQGKGRKKKGKGVDPFRPRNETLPPPRSLGRLPLSLPLERGL
mmetsp:Transcript_296/g.741  ORF Transcript_296/g.741 Transcript_296/m.741 type:complete len:294 (-) Transcript_296:165-1046(-)